MTIIMIKMQEELTHQRMCNKKNRMQKKIECKRYWNNGKLKKEKKKTPIEVSRVMANSADVNASSASFLNKRSRSRCVRSEKKNKKKSGVPRKKKNHGLLVHFRNEMTSVCVYIHISIPLSVCLSVCLWHIRTRIRTHAHVGCTITDTCKNTYMDTYKGTYKGTYKDTYKGTYEHSSRPPQ